MQLQQLAEAMASLQLPQALPSGLPPGGPATPLSTADTSPPSESSAAASESDETPSSAAPDHEHPTITLLVVADLDLASASELSEYALRHRLHIDLCIACGSFCRDEDPAKMALASSLSSSSSSSSPIASSSPASHGRNDEPHQRGGFVGRGVGGGMDGVSSAPIDRTMAGGRGGLRSIMALAGPNKSQGPNCWYPRRSATAEAAAAVGTATDAGAAASSTGGSGERCGWDATPFFRTREETSALEGLLTATLSQLENIVCRVVYCPGSTDPITTCLGQAAVPNEELGASAAAAHHQSHHPRRYTPNSRNLHRQWLPLAPGLGTAALLYLDCSDDLVQDATAALLRWSSAPGGGSHSKKRGGGGGGVDGDRQLDDDDEEEQDEDDEDDEDNEANENIALWIEQLKQLKQQYVF
jgi:hypothetical protein